LLYNQQERAIANNRRENEHMKREREIWHSDTITIGACSQKSMQEGGNTEKLIKIEKDGKLVRQCTTGVFTDAPSKGMAWENLQTFQSSC